MHTYNSPPDGGYTPGATHEVRVMSADGSAYGMLLTGPDDLCKTDAVRREERSVSVDFPLEGDVELAVTLSHSSVPFMQNAATFSPAAVVVATVEAVGLPSAATGA